MNVGLKIIKGIMYVLLCLVAVIIIIMLIMLGFNTAQRTANVNMIIKDAFAKRAEVVLMPSGDDLADREILERMFTPRALAQDDALSSTYYDAFEITNYYEHANVKFKIVWPWEEKTTVEVTEIVRDIKGTLLEVEDEADANIQPLSWANGVYEVEMKYDNASETWRINDMQMIESIWVEEEVEEPAATEEPEATATPDETPEDGEEEG